MLGLVQSGLHKEALRSIGLLALHTKELPTVQWVIQGLAEPSVLEKIAQSLPTDQGPVARQEILLFTGVYQILSEMTQDLTIDSQYVEHQSGRLKKALDKGPLETKTRVQLGKELSQTLLKQLEEGWHQRFGKSALGFDKFDAQKLDQTAESTQATWIAEVRKGWIQNAWESCQALLTQ